MRLVYKLCILLKYALQNKKLQSTNPEHGTVNKQKVLVLAFFIANS